MKKATKTTRAKEVSGPIADDEMRPEYDFSVGVAAVRNALAASVDAWSRGNLDAHVAVYADSGTAGPPIGAGGRARARADLAPFFTASRPTLRLDSLMIRPLGRDYVLATGRYVLSGPAPSRTGWFTEIWARTPDGGRILHDHSS